MEALSGNSFSTQMYRDMGIVGNYFDLLLLPGKVIGTIFDAHPETVARLKNSANNSTKEILNNPSLNPKMKAELTKQCNEINKSIDKMTDPSKQGFYFSHGYAKLMLAVFGGDIRNIFAGKIVEDYDKAQERAERQYEEMMSKKEIK